MPELAERLLQARESQIMFRIDNDPSRQTSQATGELPSSHLMSFRKPMPPARQLPLHRPRATITIYPPNPWRRGPTAQARFCQPAGRKRGLQSVRAPDAGFAVLMAGSVIATSFITGINSDLPMASLKRWPSSSRTCWQDFWKAIERLPRPERMAFPLPACRRNRDGSRAQHQTMRSARCRCRGRQLEGSWPTAPPHRALAGGADMAPVQRLSRFSPLHSSPVRSVR